MRSTKDQIRGEKSPICCDVLVVGSGIAGTMAALCAAAELDRGTGVLLACSGPLFSGSSFFPGTWGLGLVAPDGPADQEDLIQAILEVGCGVADRTLVRSFVSGIQPAIDLLERWGCTLKEPSGNAREQREYVPCFDRKHRRWRGIERLPYQRAVGERLRQSGALVRPGWELLDLTPPAADPGSAPQPGTAVFFRSQEEDFVQVSFWAAVLCAGGTSSLYPRRLTSADCRATVHSLAKQAGCDLVNLEFLQFMPGLVSPVENVVFNEKAFRFMELPPHVVQYLGGPEQAEQLLDMRSWHGPFTSRLTSCRVDLAIHRAGADGLALRPHLDDELPEFARTYFDWLQSATGTAADAPLRVAHYAHASNGGIRIDSQGRTGVPGLFAAGECTGGMHGADRIGGLSSANGLVFGQRAGTTAAKYAQATKAAKAAGGAWGILPAWTRTCCPSAAQAEEQLGRIMERHCGILRTEQGLAAAQAGVSRLLTALDEQREAATTPRDAAFARRTQLRLETAAFMLEAARKRRCSLGSHYRKDAPSPAATEGGSACTTA